MQRHTARADSYEAEILPLLKHEDTGWAGWVNQKREVTASGLRDLVVRSTMTQLSLYTVGPTIPQGLLWWID